MEKTSYGAESRDRLALSTSDGPALGLLVAQEPGNSVDSSKAANLERLCDVIDDQRETLARLDSLLGCLVTAMEYGAEAENPPHYPDVAQMARELVRQSIQRLDPLIIQKGRGNKVKDWSSPYLNRT